MNRLLLLANAVFITSLLLNAQQPLNTQSHINADEFDIDDSQMDKTLLDILPKNEKTNDELKAKNDENKKTSDNETLQITQIGDNFTPILLDSTPTSREKTFCKGKNIYTGCFIGLRLDFGVNQAIPTLKSDSINISFPSPKIEFGYEWFYNKLGLRLNTHLGYLYYGLKYATYTQINNSIEYAKNINAHALDYGASIAFLYDFIDRKKQRLGLHFGAGVAGVSFLGSNTKTQSYDGIYYDSQTNRYDIYGSVYENIDISESGIFVDGANINTLGGLQSYEHNRKFNGSTQLVGSLYAGLRLTLNTHNILSLTYEYRHYFYKKSFSIDYLASFYIQQPHIITLSYAYRF